MRHRTVSRSIGLRICLAVGLLLTPVTPGLSGSAEAREGNKTLKLYFGHTKERGEFTFKRNGRYDKKEIARINQFLRDWRRNEPADMDPQLLDLVHAVYKEAGGRDYIHVVSAYRSLKTNNMLRTRSRGVAKTSQHTAGRAMDFYIPGVPLAKLRASAMKFQRGGVGYYPSSGSPFVHVDTGSVRYWPRMPRKQLLAMFPNGETLYLPADGKPLPGYDRALARNKSSGGTALAYLETGDEKSGKGKGNWLKRVFSGGADEAEDNESTATAAAPAPAAEPAAPAVQPPAPAGQPVPAAEPPVGEQILIAGQDAPLDARLPRARPGSAADMMVATLAPELAPQGAAGAQGQTTPAEIPVPRSRPDAQLLAQTLDPAKTAPASLAVDPEDAIALLSLAAAPEPAPAAPVQVAALTPDAGKKPASEADLAAIDAFTAIDGATTQTPRTPDGVAVPRPRPLALAFAGGGLPPADVALPAARPAGVSTRPTTASVPDATAPAPAVKGSRIAAVAQPEPPEPAYDADQDTLRNLLYQPAPAVAQPAPAAPVARDVTPTVAQKGDFAGLAMPKPDGTPELFKVPASAQSVAPGPVPSLPTDRFQPTTAAEPPAEESFFSRLFASVVE